MANKVSYLDNLQKELGQWKAAARGSTNKSGKPNSKSGQDAYRSALGQLGGALLQGRRYSDKTAKQIKANKK